MSGSFAAGRRPAVMEITSFGLAGMEFVAVRNISYYDIIFFLKRGKYTTFFFTYSKKNKKKSHYTQKVENYLIRRFKECREGIDKEKLILI
jgi:hypothetical protein